MSEAGGGGAGPDFLRSTQTRPTHRFLNRTGLAPAGGGASRGRIPGLLPAGVRG